MKRALALLALACAAAATVQAGPRDPFALPVRASAAPAPAAPLPRLRAIMFDPGHSLADLDGQVLAVGDWVGDYRVAAIAERSVTLVRGGTPVVVALDKGAAK